MSRRSTAKVLRRAHGALSEAPVDARIVTAYSGSAELDTTTVTSKGQVTIPKDVRRRFGIRQGSRVEFSVVGDHVELRVVSRAAEAKPSGFGLLKSKRRTVPADLDPASLIRR